MHGERLSTQLQAIVDTLTRIYAHAKEINTDGALESDFAALLAQISTIRSLPEVVARDAQALHNAHAYLRVIFDNIKDYAVFTISLDNIITHWNISAEHVFGWSEAKAVGQSGRMIFTPEDRAKSAPEQEILTAIERGMQKISAGIFVKMAPAFSPTGHYGNC